MPKLNQILAIEKQTKTSCETQLTALYHQLQKEALLGGISRTYKPLHEEGERFPDESQQVQLRVANVLQDVERIMSPLFDITAVRDSANLSAVADVVVDGVPLLTGVPAVTLIWLEKKLVDLHTLVVKLPELSQTESWHFDGNADCYASNPVETAKSKKIPKPFVKAEATDKHPAQVDVVHEDVLQGYWTTVKFSGAVPLDRKRELRDRVERLLTAVKFAREQANMVDAPKVSIAKEVFGFLFA